MRSSRTGIDDEAAKLLVERSILRDKGKYFFIYSKISIQRYILDNKLYFTRDDSLRNVIKFNNYQVFTLFLSL